jgi:tripartite-type tricarboxylate transporter receptor subunit TctC
MKAIAYRVVACALLLAAISVQPCLAQPAYPSAPVRLVVPYPPGGPSDILARRITPKLGEVLRQPVVVDNRPGAAGNIGAENVAKSAPDGYSMVMVSPAHAANISLYDNIGYDPIKDFETVTVLSASPYVLVVNPSVSATTLAELVALAKARPGALNYASGGSGTGPQLAMELLKQRTGTNIVHIPYKGAGPAMADVMSGQVQMMMIDLTAGIRAGQAGKVRMLAVSSEQRSPAAPQVPTIAESGVPGFNETGTQGILVPAGTPRAIVEKLHQAFVETLANPDVREFLATQGAVPVGITPQQYGERLRADVEKWRKIIKELGLRPN